MVMQPLYQMVSFVTDEKIACARAPKEMDQEQKTETPESLKLHINETDVSSSLRELAYMKSHQLL